MHASRIKTVPHLACFADLKATFSHCTLVQNKGVVGGGTVLGSHSKEPAVFTRSIHHPNVTHGERRNAALQGENRVSLGESMKLTLRQPLVKTVAIHSL